MASTNKTSNLELSQFIATDTPTWLVDYNGDMEKIDAGVGRVEELAETASTQAVGVASGLQTTNQNVTTLSGQVANVQNQANTTSASVNGINQRLGNTDISGIGDGTITGAINAQNSNLDGITHISENGIITNGYVVAYGSVVCIQMDGVPVNTLNSWVTVGTLPVGLRPKRTIYCAGYASNNTDVVCMSILADGQIQLYSTKNNFHGTATFIAQQ